jgi:ubiquitin-conjugating enzyme E2 A
MSKLSTIRLSKELAKLQSDQEKLEGIIIDTPTDLNIWKAKIIGPKDTPYEGGIFELKLSFDSDYPIKSPSVKFITPMYHPNIYRDGQICVDILQGEWSPSQNIRTILMSIISLLSDPNPSSPANREAANLYLSDRKAYDKKVKEFIDKIK